MPKPDLDYDKLIEHRSPEKKPRFRPDYWGALPFAVGISLIAAANRGDLDKVRLSDFDPWIALQLAGLLVLMIYAIHGVVAVSYWIWPGKDRH